MVAAAFAKKGRDIVVLDMSRAVTYTDFFILVTGGTTRQTKALAQSIRESLRAESVRPVRAEGEAAGEWILLDFLDAVVHIFTPAAREFYRLESLWGDVPSLPLREDDDVDLEWERLGAAAALDGAEEESA